MEQKEFLKSFSLYGMGCLLQALCQSIRKIREHTGGGPLNEEQQVLVQRIGELQSCMMQKYPYSKEPETKARILLAMMDAYEISGEAPVLQFALAQAEAVLPVLSSSPLKCKLFSYAYHYVEEPECAREARCIIDSWKDLNYTEEMQEAVRYYQDLTGQNYR